MSTNRIPNLSSYHNLYVAVAGRKVLGHGATAEDAFNHARWLNRKNGWPEKIIRTDSRGQPVEVLTVSEIGPRVTRKEVEMIVDIFTDGSCLGNPGPGGYAAILRFGPHEKVLTGQSEHTTNNRAELAGAIAGLAVLKKRCRIRLHTDSQYLIRVANNGAKARANLDLINRLRSLTGKHDVEFVYDPQHPEITRAHYAARNAAAA